MAVKWYAVFLKPKTLKNGFKKTGIWPFTGLEGIEENSACYIPESLTKQEQMDEVKK